MMSIQKKVYLYLYVQHTIHVVRMSSDVPTVDVYLKVGNVTMKMTVKMDLMKLVVYIHHVLMENSHVQTLDVFLCHK